jgi:hypothetical protein
LKDRIIVDNLLYNSCKDYADRLVQQRITKAEKPACDGSDGIIELCERCPYYRFLKVNHS